MPRSGLGSQPLNVTAVTLALGLGLIVECTKGGPDADVSGTTEGRSELIDRNDTDSDGMIIAEVERKFAAEGRIDDATVETTAADGVVTLKGRVAEEGQKQRFGAIAAEIAGVKGVDNRLIVAR